MHIMCESSFKKQNTGFLHSVAVVHSAFIVKTYEFWYLQLLPVLKWISFFFVIAIAILYMFLYVRYVAILYYSKFPLCLNFKSCLCLVLWATIIRGGYRNSQKLVVVNENWLHLFIGYVRSDQSLFLLNEVLTSRKVLPASYRLQCFEEM